MNEFKFANNLKMYFKAKLILFILLYILLRSGYMFASDPRLARYGNDPSQVFWFIQISDTHIDSPVYTGEEDKLTWVLTEGVNVVDPYFVVNTGDLTDSTSDNFPYYGTGPHPEEWDKYRNIVDGAGMTSDFYFDLIGNHDAYNDPGASLYLSRSVAGSAQRTTQPHWRLDLPFGSYHFIAVATTCNDWLQWPFDNTNITGEEYNELLEKLEANTDTHLTIAAGHHDYTNAAGGGVVDELFSSYGIPYYIHGHDHDLRTSISSRNVIIQRINSLGQSNENNFCVHAIDSDAISMSCADARNPWPLAVITAPTDVRLGSNNNIHNPYAPSVPVTCNEAPIRVLVFDSITPATVTFWWENSSITGPLIQSASIPHQWLGTFDATSFSPGIHTLNVEVIGTQTRDFNVQVLFEDRVCDLYPPTNEEELEQIEESVPDIEVLDESEVLEIEEIAQDILQQDNELANQDILLQLDEDGNIEEKKEDELGGNLSGGGCNCAFTHN